MWNGTLVSVLRAVSQLDTPPGDAVLRSLETEALWRVRRFSYKQLAYLMEWALTERARLARLGQGDGPALANELAKQLELRWTELSEPRTVGVLMGRAAHLPPSLIEKLEDKVHAHTHTHIYIRTYMHTTCSYTYYIHTYIHKVKPASMT